MPPGGTVRYGYALKPQKAKEKSMIAERVRRLGLSPTLRVSAMAKEMRAAGVDVLDFSAGQSDFPTPPDVCDAGKREHHDECAANGTRTNCWENHLAPISKNSPMAGVARDT